MPTFTHDGVVLGFDDTGEADLAPVVLLHGLSSARSTWHRLTEELRGRYRVLALDHRGHGESAHAPGTYTLEHYVPDAIALIEDRAAQPAVLIGHSLGGVIAACVAQRRPDLVRAVLLEDPPLFYATRDRDEPGPLLTMFGVMRQVYGEMQARGAPIEEYEALVQRAPAMSGKGTMADVLGAEGVHLQAQSMARLDPEVFTSAIDGTALATAQPNVPLGCPAHVLRAEADLAAAFSADDEAAFLATNPDATVTFVAGASHLIHDDQPERFRDEVEGFLSGNP